MCSLIDRFEGIVDTYIQSALQNNRIEMWQELTMIHPDYTSVGYVSEDYKDVKYVKKCVRRYEQKQQLCAISQPTKYTPDEWKVLGFVWIANLLHKIPECGDIKTTTLVAGLFKWPKCTLVQSKYYKVNGKGHHDDFIDVVINPHNLNVIEIDQNFLSMEIIQYFFK